VAGIGHAVTPRPAGWLKLTAQWHDLPKKHPHCAIIRKRRHDRRGVGLGRADRWLNAANLPISRHAPKQQLRLGLTGEIPGLHNLTLV
jgi:hypothetical protein